MSNEKKAPNRRDLRDAKGYLGDLFAGTEDWAPDEIVDKLITSALSINVQRSTDVLVFKFDQSEEPGQDDGEGEIPGQTAIDAPAEPIKAPGVAAKTGGTGNQAAYSIPN